MFFFLKTSTLCKSIFTKGIDTYTRQLGKLCFLILITCTFVGSVLAEEVLVPASTSCRTDKLQPGTNRFDSSKLSIRADASAAKSWIKFDISDLEHRGSIRGAVLRLTLHDDEGDYNFDVSAVNDGYKTNIGWAERDITWNNAPANDTTDQYNPDFTKATKMGTVYLTGNYFAGTQHFIDVLPAIQGDSDGIIQFILHNSNSLINCATHSHSGREAYWPTLILTYPPLGADFPNPDIRETVSTDFESLSWQPGSGSMRSEIYFGKDATVVAAAQRLGGDVNGDGLVDLSDLAEMAFQWLQVPSDPCPDLDGSGLVDLSDFSKVGASWYDSADVVYLGATSGDTFDMGVLDPSTTYYWRVDSVSCDDIEPGEVWDFNTKVSAFPGADGFGKWASGGRGGSVYHVTNLNDSGIGSFRDAVSGTNRTVVFDVSGIINIGSRIVVNKDITIAGQTAPGEGIMIYGNGLSYTKANRSITRYMRYRMGVGGDSGKDAVGIANGTDMIFDHCSISWGRDENFSISGGTGEDPGFITIQDCIIAQGLLSHSCGGLVIDWDDGISILRSLYTDNHTRNPKVRGINEFINNVVYNWNATAYIMAWTTSTTDYSYVNAINNYFISGPNMDNTPPFRYGNSAFHIYQSNNWYDSDKDGILDGRLLTTADYRSNNETVVTEPYNYPSVQTLLEPVTAVKSVGSSCGALLPLRDRTDKRLIEEMMSYGTMGQHISSENNSPMYGVGTLESGINPTDTDQDGMPDYWEGSIAGLDMYTADHNGDVNGNGYTNLEDYINWLGDLHADVQKNVDVDIDLRLFTSGFDTGATYTVLSSTHGTAVIQADGYTVSYTPDTDYVGLVELTFTVDDGDAMTQTIQQLVSEYGGNPLPPVYPANLANGLDYSYYTGIWQYLPNFDSLTPAQIGSVSNFNISSAPAVDSFAYEFGGFIDVPSDGQYTFYTTSDDGSRLYIDDSVVVSNEGVHGITEVQGKAALLAGMHKIRVTYFENSGGQALQVRWAGPGFARQLIPNTVLYRGSLDTIPPATPNGLLALAANSQVFLDWQDNGEMDLAGYNIYRTTTSGAGYIQINTSIITISGYTDTDVVNGILYHYMVRAVDTFINESEDTSEVSARPVASGTGMVIQENTMGFCDLDGTVDNNNARFTSDGFANTDNNTGTGINWKVNVATAGTYTVTWRYANGGGSDRPGALLVGGSTVLSNISFPDTGGWTTWNTVSKTVSMTAGIKDVRLQATGTSGLSNIDYIEITGVNVTPATCF